MSTESEELKALSFVRRALLRKNERLRELNRRVVTLQEENEKLKWKCQDQEKEITRLNSELGLANDALQTERFETDDITDDPSATALGDDFSNADDTSNQQNERLGIGVDGGNQNIDFSDPNVNIKKELAEGGQHEAIAGGPGHDPSYVGAEEYELSEKAFGAGAAGRAGPGGSSDPGGGGDETNYGSSDNFAVPAGTDALDPAALLAGDLAVATASGAGPLQNIPSGRAARNRISTSQAAGSGGSPQVRRRGRRPARRGLPSHLDDPLEHARMGGEDFITLDRMGQTIPGSSNVAGPDNYLIEPQAVDDLLVNTAHNTGDLVFDGNTGLRVQPGVGGPPMRHQTRNPAHKFACQLCGKSFAKNHDLKRHVQAHTGLKPFWCPHCPYRSIKNSVLRRHVASVHTDRPLLSCPHQGCAQLFVHGTELDRHVKRCVQLSLAS